MNELQKKYEKCKKPITISRVAEILEADKATLKLIEKELQLEISKYNYNAGRVYDLKAVELFSEILRMIEEGFYIEEIEQVIEKVGKERVDRYINILKVKQSNNIYEDRNSEIIDSENVEVSKDGEFIQNDIITDDESLEERYLKYGEAVSIQVVAQLLNVDTGKLKMYEKELKLNLGELRNDVYVYSLSAIEQFLEVLCMREKEIPLYVIEDIIHQDIMLRHKSYKLIIGERKYHTTKDYILKGQGK